METETKQAGEAMLRPGKCPKCGRELYETEFCSASVADIPAGRQETYAPLQAGPVYTDFRTHKGYCCPECIRRSNTVRFAAGIVLMALGAAAVFAGLLVGDSSKLGFVLLVLGVVLCLAGFRIERYYAAMPRSGKNAPAGRTYSEEEKTLWSDQFVARYAKKLPSLAGRILFGRTAMREMNRYY